MYQADKNMLCFSCKNSLEKEMAVNKDPGLDLFKKSKIEINKIVEGWTHSEIKLKSVSIEKFVHKFIK